MNGKATRWIAGGFAWCLLALGAAVCPAAEPSPADATAEELMRQATAAESAQRTNEAVAAYERLLRRDTAFEAVVAPRLVELYCGSGQAAPALAWAARVARRRPDPKAYLAGVFARLGQWKEAELLLRQTLSNEKMPSKRVPLLWQLAEAQERQGDGLGALAALTGAAETAGEDALRNTSAQRRDALRQRLETTRKQAQQQRREPGAEGNP